MHRLEMTDNSCVKVAVRIRPLVKSETDKGCKDILEVYQEQNQLHIRDSDKSFTYNYVLDSAASQDQLYDACVSEMIPNLFKGYNLTILAYGQTGSGKTHTMGTCYAGQEDQMGVIPKSITKIFDYVRDNFAFEFRVSVSFVELYQEVLYDLLAEKPRDQCVLDIREDPHRGTHIPGIKEKSVQSITEVFNCLAHGSSGRATGCTNMNAQSSRSHAIFTINIVMQNKSNSNEHRSAKFHFVDLAGSERPKKTGAVGTTFKEGVNINKGLLVLGNVISALGDEKQESSKFIPYRDSNLTRLLKDSLGGNSITLMIACVSPADYNLEETLSTLRYADRARKIRNKPIINQDPKNAELIEMKKTIKKLQLQIIGQGEVESLMKANSELKIKNECLVKQLSSMVCDKTGLLEKVIIVQHHNDNLVEKIEELKEQYRIMMGDNNLAEETKSNLLPMQKYFDDLNIEFKKSEDELKQHEANIDNVSHGSASDQKEISARQENHNSQQIALSNELKELSKQLAMKEHLADQMAKNSEFMVDYAALAENESKIQALEKEKNGLMQQLKTAQQGGQGKLLEIRRKRVQELESQIQELNKKLTEQNKLIKLKAKDEMKVKQLNNEIVQMKQSKVRLMRTMREEAEQFRNWKIAKDKDLNKLRQEDIKKQNKIVKMQAMHLKQQNVLKRKVEEAVAVNKRLKEALSMRKNVQEHKFGGRLEKVGVWLKQELQVILGLIEIEVSLNGLLEDRGTLQQQLDILIENNGDPAQIQSIKDDLELRSVQIQDMQQKLLDSDEDTKSQINFDHIQSMAEAKYALKLLTQVASEIKRKECVLSQKSIELENVIANESLHQKHTDRSVDLEKKDSLQLQQDYEDKIAVLLGQLRNVEEKSNEKLEEKCEILVRKINDLEKLIESYEEDIALKDDRLSALHAHIETLEKQEAVKKVVISPLSSRENSNETFVLPDIKDEDKTEDKSEYKMKRIKLIAPDTTFVYEVTDEKENLSKGIPNIEDLKRDPDWRKTPLGRRILKEKRKMTVSKLDLEERELNVPYKRSSDGGCACTTTCKGRCGCRKLQRACTSACKCTITSCLNQKDTSFSDSSSHNGSSRDNFKKPRS